MIKFVFLILFLTSVINSKPTNYLTYKVNFIDKKNEVIITSNGFHNWFSPLVLDSITDSKDIKYSSEINNCAELTLTHEFIKDTIHFSIINYRYFLINNKFYKLDSVYRHHFWDILPKYYFDSLIVE